VDEPTRAQCARATGWRGNATARGFWVAWASAKKSCDPCVGAGLIDIERRDIEVYQLRGDRYGRVPVVLGSGARLPPFEQVELPIERFWL
jgi:hypothetical protein